MCTGVIIGFETMSQDSVYQQLFHSSSIREPHSRKRRSNNLVQRMVKVCGLDPNDPDTLLVFPRVKFVSGGQSNVVVVLPQVTLGLLIYTLHA